MKVSSAPCTAFPRRGESSFTFQRCLLAIFLATTVFLLFTFSDACVLPPPFKALELVSKPKPYYEVGEEITYKCKAGYDQLLGLLTIATCEPNHTWVPISDDACIKRKCTYLEGPKNGRVEYINSSHVWGAQVHFICSDGFYLVGKQVVRCVLKGEYPEWDSQVPQCEKVLCSPPPKIKDGKYTFSDIEVFEYMEAVTYSCNKIPGGEELSLVGKSELYCAGNGVWSSNPPECKVVRCPFPEVENGKQLSGFGKKFSYQATVVFECIQGYYMNGSNTVVCSSASTWDPPLPTCLKGPKPTHPKKPSVHNYPGYPNPTEGLFDDEFAKWIMVLIILISIVGVAIIFLWLYRYFQRRKKKGKANIRAQYNTYQKRSSTPAEQTA
ncbi:membrane cofactor protein isoform X3 [Sciurus carolinensis]|uniref:membrane cofactor protein isoform X3 n=2 Tax=Sciurus carolinensis TaxID=30640 RepID=UPI001FB3CB08|nr:membrane cofactor protein isoform X3 [Sciurus carolinensis]